MVYNKLINFALSRSFLTHNSIRVESAFSKEEVDLIVASLRDGEKEQGQIGTIEAEAETLLKFRSSRVSFINYSKEIQVVDGYKQLRKVQEINF